MLGRAVDESSDVAGGTDSRFEVPAPSLRTEGNVTVVENFPAIADRLARDPEAVLGAIQDELGTAASLDDRGRARLTGRFKRDRVASAIESYTDSYVLCPECGLPDTRLVTEDGSTVLACDACGARSPVDDG